MSTSQEEASAPDQTQAAESITAFMTADHHRISSLWEQTLAAIEREDFNALHTLSAEFLNGFRRHLRIEDDILFPAIEEKTGLQKTGPVWAMRMEHRDLERVLRRLEPLLTVQELSTAIQAVDGETVNPSLLFRSHDGKEEAVLYPMADRTLGAQAAQEIVARMRAEPATPAPA